MCVYWYSCAHGWVRHGAFWKKPRVQVSSVRTTMTRTGVQIRRPGTVACTPGGPPTTLTAPETTGSSDDGSTGSLSDVVTPRSFLMPEPERYRLREAAALGAGEGGG